MSVFLMQIIYAMEMMEMRLMKMIVGVELFVERKKLIYYWHLRSWH